ncbi:MAG: haloacid dehalogenase-like hydrolase [Spirochaetia bacterium]|jgi:2-hydroxy-3-keto-5-methylthiopentenyl-1-phosphate phosphatase|nr:haloacid dehalogenase-like hydrolase [Spirochaetia bacterium]
MADLEPTLAMMYDFDRTLCTKEMQEYSFIPGVGMTPQQFWEESNSLAAEKKMDRVLAYMHLMLERAHVARKSIKREDFVALGKDLEFYPGVLEWFARINSLGQENGIQVEHYIISSGLREIIEGSDIFRQFKEVFACEFLYDENNIACWPKNVVNYTTKTQFLFRINKGVLDLSDDMSLNKYTPEDERPVPFRNMVYIGDGMTDVPCMKLVKVNGGCSIAVYRQDCKENVEVLLKDGRVDFITPADYSQGSELDRIVHDVVCNIAMTDDLKRKSKAQFDLVR